MKDRRERITGAPKHSRRMLPIAVKSLPHLLIFAISVSFSAPARAADQATGATIGAVYVASNEFSGNKILPFLRFADGSLAPAGPGVPTYGLGSGPYLYGLVFPPVTDDPLASTNSLIVDQQGKHLFVVNAGSNDVSVFAIAQSGLTLVDRKPSGGIFPVSLTFGNGTLYALNAADNSLAVFHVDNGGLLTNLQTCELPALPPRDADLTGDATHSSQPVNSETASQVGLSPDGKKLVVLSKEGAMLANFPGPPLLGSGRIHVYDLDDHDHTLKDCGNPTTTVLPNNSNGLPKWPFSFTWSQEGQLLVAEVYGVTTSLSGSAVSSFALHEDGSLAPISVSVGNGQPVMCWIVSNGRRVYTTNYASDNISSYTVDSNGQVTLADSSAAAFGPSFTEFPIDLAITDDGRFLYQLAPGSATVKPFEIDPLTGTLTRLADAPTGQLAHSGQAGIATIDFRVEMAFDFKPHDLNLKARDRRVTGYLRPPAPYLASQIDVASIRLNGTVAVSTEHPPKLEGNGARLKVEFLRTAVTPVLTTGDHVPVIVTGSIAGDAFIGTDYIKVKGPKIHAPHDGDQLAAGSTAQVTWDTPEGATSVTLLSSLDDGVTWSVEAQDIANTGSYSWRVPGVSTSNARLEVMAVYEADETGVVPEAEYAVSDAFSISTPLGVDSAGASFALRATNPVMGPLAMRYSLASAEPASLTVYDVSGREVAAREVGSSGPGWHTAKIGNLPAGIYMVRLSQAGRIQSARVAVMR